MAETDMERRTGKGESKVLRWFKDYCQYFPCKILANVGTGDVAHIKLDFWKSWSELPCRAETDPPFFSGQAALRGLVGLCPNRGV
jgi:hypothetical protein